MKNIDDFETNSPNELICIIRSLKIQQKELKKINNDL